jgi:glucose uptake protein
VLIPASVVGVSVLLFVSLLCWGSWASTLKAAGKWRFEFYYCDFTLGVAVAAVAAAYTLGSWNEHDLTFQDNFLLAGYRKMAWCLGAGIVFNLANLLLLAGTTTSSMTTAFPITFALAWAVGAVWQYTDRAGVNGMLTAAGSVMMMASLVMAAIAWSWHREAEEHKKITALRADPRVRRPGPRAPGAARGIVLSIIGGLFMGAFFPALLEGVSGDNGVSAYGALLLIAAGIAGSSLLFVPFFLNFPVQGEPLVLGGYLKGTRRQHLLGLAGGVIWAAGVLAALVASEPEGISIPQPVQYVLMRAGPVLASVLGLTLWRELPDAPWRARMMLAATLVLFVAGLWMIGVAPVYKG